MADSNNTRVRFLGGAIARQDLIGALAYPVGLDKTGMEFTRFYTRLGERWFQQEYASDLVSVCYCPAGQDRGWWLLGKRGDVHSITAAGPASGQIAEAGTGPGKLGYAKRIRAVHDTLYICGYRRQVYRREGTGWTSVADTIHAGRDEVGFCFNDIAGLPNGELFAVGDRGEVWWFDRHRWHAIDSGTQSHLEAVAAHGQQVVVAGRDGVVLMGDHRGFAAIGPTTPDTDFWDVAVFDGLVFVAASAGVYTISLTPDHSFARSSLPPHVGYHLAADNSRLVSFGTHQVFAYDGHASEEFVCPDNR